jgi:steroid delta-isomerase-like uncharacterized protein
MSFPTPRVVATAFAVLSLSAAAQARAGERPAHLARSCSAQQVRHNETLARTVFDDIISRGLIDENEHIYHRDFVIHGLTRDAGRKEDRASTIGWREAAPDVRMTVLRLVADCDMVAANFEATGTNTGKGNGLPGTGKSVRAQGVTFFRFRDGLIAEEWTVFDQYTMLKQLGLLAE